MGNDRIDSCIIYEKLIWLLTSTLPFPWFFFWLICAGKYFYFIVVLPINTLKKAHDRARQAEVTSNLESGDDSPETKKRPHNKGSLEEFPDCSDSKLIMS